MIRLMSVATYTVALSLLAGCGGDGVVNPPAAGDEDEDNVPSGPTLSLHVTLRPEDAPVADELGWTAGVPGATIELARVDQFEYNFVTVRADSVGRFVLPELEAGFYWVAAEREVPDSLLEGTSLAGSTPRFLGGGAKFALSSSEILEDRVVTVPVRPNQPSGVVFSEIYPMSPPSFETGDQWIRGGIYLEIYNGSEEMVFLDGMILGKAYQWWFDSSRFGHHACGASEGFRNDPTGVWSSNHWRFPGSGSEHPLPPGEVALVAVNAQDHTGIHPTMLDLSDADFELLQRGTADNPAVPNLEHITPERRDPGDLGLPRAHFFLSRAVNVEGLAESLDPGDDLSQGVIYRFFARGDLLDVVYVWHDSSNDPLPFCRDPVHPDFDALPGEAFAGVVAGEGFLANVRRVIGSENGRPLLLDTNTSKVDFFKGERTPGWIPGG